MSGHLCHNAFYEGLARKVGLHGTGIEYRRSVSSRSLRCSEPLAIAVVVGTWCAKCKHLRAPSHQGGCRQGPCDSVPPRLVRSPFCLYQGLWSLVLIGHSSSSAGAESLRTACPTQCSVTDGRCAAAYCTSPDHQPTSRYTLFIMCVGVPTLLLSTFNENYSRGLGLTR